MKNNRTVLLVLVLMAALVAPATSAPPARAAAPTRVFLPVQGVMSPIERRGYTFGFGDGLLIRAFNTYDSDIGKSVAGETALQLDMMRAMGINTFSIALSAADPEPGAFVPPACTVNPDLGLTYPQPTPTELTNLAAFLDLLQNKGMHLELILSSTHMEEQPPVNNTTWIGSILAVVKDKPALDLVMFGGDAHLVDLDVDGVPESCGGRAEPDFGLGPSRVGATYVKWAIGYAHSLGLPYRKLSAEAIIGYYPSMVQTPNQFMDDGHYWDPLVVLKGIFDSLGIPNDQRTYALSFYEHRKCMLPPGFDIPCVDENPHQWAIDTFNQELNVVGRGNGVRLVAAEMGSGAPAQEWSPGLALESLTWIMHRDGIDGGCFWRWVNFDNSEDFRSDYSSPVLQISPEFSYNPVKDVLQTLFSQGQTDDLSLTPDSTPPVFGLLSKNPAVVKNGDALEITASLGETHLFVTADLSSLDSSQTVPLVLADQGDGTYKANTTLRLWNDNPNGLKTIPLWAMDFWSNTSQATLEITLNNPAQVRDAVPPNDTFDGSVLNAKKWLADTAANSQVSQDGRLNVSTSNETSFSSGGVNSTWHFTGDFDVQVDFEIGAGWATPADGHLDGAYLGVNIGSQSIAIDRLRSPVEDRVFAWRADDIFIGKILTSAIRGKFRLIRTGTSLVTLVDMGGGWQDPLHVTVPADPAQVFMGAGSIFASQAFTTHYDNFHINAGRTDFRQEIYLPLIFR